MGSLLLIRHGQAAYGEADHDRLTPRGIEQE
jgi:phosphohistidine phosphatase SixA